MNTINDPTMRFDAMRGTNHPHRLTQRQTREEVERFAASIGLRVDWHTTHRIGMTTAEVTLVK